MLYDTIKYYKLFFYDWQNIEKIIQELVENQSNILSTLL
jgi:hypothetical protein